MDKEIIAKGNGKISYREGTTRVKVFDHDYKKSDVLNEALNQVRVEETGLRIPKLLEVAKVDGKWSIVTEYVERETLESRIEAHPEQLEKLYGAVRALAAGDPEQALAASDKAQG